MWGEDGGIGLGEGREVRKTSRRKEIHREHAREGRKMDAAGRGKDTVLGEDG
jgi:hypothetical protein